MRYKSKPIEVEAALFDGHSIPEFARDRAAISEDGHSLVVQSHEGERLCSVGDYLVLTDGGQLLVRDGPLFETLFELIF